MVQNLRRKDFFLYIFDYFLKNKGPHKTDKRGETDKAKRLSLNISSKKERRKDSFRYFTRPMMIVFLSALLIAIISFPISSALYDPSKENMKLMTEDEWPSHGPWIVTVGN